MFDLLNFEFEGYMIFWMSLYNNVGVKIRKDYNKWSSKRKKKEFLNGFFFGNWFLFRFINNVLYLIFILVDYVNGIESLKFVFFWLVSKRFDYLIL